MAEAKRQKLSHEVEDAGGVEVPDVAEDDPLLQEVENVQAELEQVNDQSSEEVLQVEQKYNKLRRPLYDKRARAIANIPDFWYKALTQHPVIRGIAGDGDLGLLAQLKELDVEDFEDIKSGFRITFTFQDPSTYEGALFTNTSVTKTLRFGDNGKLTKEVSEVNWTESGESAVYVTLQNEETGEVERGISPDYQFVGWLLDEAQEIEDGHDEVAEAIKDDIWPTPVRFFKGEVEFAFEFDQVSEDDDDDNEDDGDDGGDDD